MKRSLGIYHDSAKACHRSGSQTLIGLRIDLFVDVVPVAFFTNCWLVQRLVE